MKKIILLLVVALVPVVLSGCVRKCESEPIIEENHTLIVTPHLGEMRK